jgi:hypothetical protein
MKRLAKALNENLKNYENAYGEIEESESPKEMGFKTK